MAVAAVGYAQVDPAADFAVDWIIVERDDAGFTFGATVASTRGESATLEFTLELLRTAPDEKIASGRQVGLMTTPAGGADTTSRIAVTLSPGDRVEARLLLEHVQEGWELRDTLVRIFGSAPTPEPAPRLAADPDFLEIDGLVIDRVITKPGRDFYELFYRDWDAPFGAQNYTLLIEETPFRGRQTIIKVSLDNQLIYQQILQTRYDVLEEMVANAVAVARGALERQTQAQEANGGDYVEQF